MRITQHFVQLPNPNLPAAHCEVREHQVYTEAAEDKWFCLGMS